MQCKACNCSKTCPDTMTWIFDCYAKWNFQNLLKMKVKTHKYTIKHRDLQTNYITSANLNDFVSSTQIVLLTRPMARGQNVFLKDMFLENCSILSYFTNCITAKWIRQYLHLISKRVFWGIPNMWARILAHDATKSIAFLSSLSHTKWSPSFNNCNIT